MVRPPACAPRAARWPAPPSHPAGALYRRLLPRLSPTHVEAALAAWVRATRPVRDREPLAFDGKTVRGAGTATQPAPHLLSVSTHQTHETLVQVRVDDHTNEIPVAQALLPHLPLRGRVVTADALHTQTALAQVIVAHGGDYLLCVKGNHGRLYQERAVYCADPHATARTVTTVDRQRGRTAPRTLQASTRLSAYLARSWARSGGKGSAPSPADRARSHGAAYGDRLRLRLGAHARRRTPRRGQSHHRAASLRERHGALEQRRGRAGRVCRRRVAGESIGETANSDSD